MILVININRKVIVAAITGRNPQAKIPTHVEIETKDKLDKDSVILLEQIGTLDKKRLKEKLTILIR